MKLLFILLLMLALVGAYAYWRLRPYIRAVRQIFGVARGASRVSIRTQGVGDAPQVGDQQASESLVRCASCGTWIPASRAVSLGGRSAQFAQHSCLEAARPTPTHHAPLSLLTSNQQRIAVDRRNDLAYMDRPFEKCSMTGPSRA